MKIIFIILLLLMACTRQVKQFNEPVKTSRFLDYDTDSVYLYIPSTLGAPRKITGMKPFSKGSEQLVKLKWTKQGLSVYSSDEDLRFDFSRNQKPVFTIPGEYKDFKCGPSHRGECDDEDNSQSWDKRPYFFPNLSKIDFKSSLNILDLTLDDNGCFVERNANVTDQVIERGVINIEMEKEFVISKNEACLKKYLVGQDLDPSELSFKTTFYYSLVRLNDLASPDYEPRAYPIEDQVKFGFFKNTQKIYDDNYYTKAENNFINRWNPKKKKVVYYLSDSFEEEGQEVFKEISLKAFSDINKVLKAAKVPFELELLEGEGKKSGDLRYNMINLITDPLENGLLGYGPSISNPLTGEILSATVNMYSGTLRRTVPTVYKKMEKLSREEAKSKFHLNPALARTLELIKRWPRKERPLDLNNLSTPEVRATLGVDPRVSLSSDFYSPEEHRIPDASVLLKDTYMESLNFLTKHNAYPSELYLNGGKGRTYIEGIKEFKEIWNENATLKKWDELSKVQKEKITKMILPHIFRTTLIHEMGHNLGLRHNFKGSMDEKNFYKNSDFDKNTAGKRSLFGIEISYLPTFSSIMDYGYSELNELPIFGKYDLAALRYAYASEIQLENGEYKKIDEKGIANEPIRRYEFCTDESAGGSTLCDRFDEGTSYTEIMNHYARKYEDFYETRNFRNHRDNFNLIENADYYLARRAEFSRVRKIFETWESIVFEVIRNQGKKDASVKEQRLIIQKLLASCLGREDLFCKSFLDIENATKIAAKFFLNILKMPNRECLLSNDKIVALDLFHRAFKLKEAPKSCFDPALPSDLKDSGISIRIIGERGKFIQDLQEYNPRFKYSTDLAAKGIWIDKILAIQYLVGRNLSSNTYQDPQLSFLDHPTLGPVVEKFIEDLILQRPLDNPISFRDKMGKIIKVREGATKTVLSRENNPLIPAQVSLSLMFSLNLPLNSYPYLSTTLLNSMINVSSSADPSAIRKSDAFLANLGVKKVDGHIDLDAKKFTPEIILSDGKKYAGSDRFVLASKIISDLNKFGYLDGLKTLNDYLEESDPPITGLKINKFLKKIYFLKINPYLDISKRGLTFQDPISGFEGDKKKSLEVSVYVLDEIIKSFEKDGVGEAYFQEIFSKEPAEINLPQRAIYLRNNLSKEELIQSKNFLLNSYSPPPDFKFMEIYNMAEENLGAMINLTEDKVRSELEDLLKGLKAF